MMPNSKNQTYQLHLKLNDVNPEIWRRILIPSDFILEDFHYVIQTCMGWEDMHIHSFSKAENTYSIPDEDIMNEGDLDESEYTLDNIFSKENEIMEYLYDPGNEWKHTIKLEKILNRKGDDPDFPVCIGGERACPPEDVGGSKAYMEFLQALTNDKDPRHKEYIEWIGGEFDSGNINIELINVILREEWSDYQDDLDDD